MQQQYADLELNLHRYEVGVYTLEFRFSLPDSNVFVGLDQADPVRISIDLKADIFNKPMVDAQNYGKVLSSILFEDEKFSTAFEAARAKALDRDFPIRCRFGSSDPALHALRWETLLDPQSNAPLAANENFIFSRYQSSSDSRPMRLRPRGNLRALIAVANPSDLASYKLDPINVYDEIERAVTSLDKISTKVLPEFERHVTLNEIINALRSEEIDIFYLVCHGVFVRDEPILILEDQEGKRAAVSGGQLYERIRQLPKPPRLAILISCQSAGNGEGEVLSALGPRLVQAGVPAVIAMQDNFSMETSKQFITVFIRELHKDGQVDRAMSAARNMIQDRSDFWVPVLYMRLKSGRLWYTPGRSIDGTQFTKFPAVVQNIRKERATPIIGPGLLEPIHSSLREIAWEWSEKFNYPMAPYERESLPQVAQYLYTSLAKTFPLDELKDYLFQRICSLHNDELPSDIRKHNNSLDELIDEVGKCLRQKNPMDPHHILAQFNLPVYFTANPDTLLESAIKEIGHTPQSILCPWNSEMDYQPLEIDPTPENPVVFHFFGRWDNDHSLVLTEDQYFAFLIGVTRNYDLIPSKVRQALANAGLLFLGFRTDEWAFRILFQTIMAQEGRAMRGKYAQVAAQVEPEDERLLRPPLALKFIQDYFRDGADIEIYWGSPQEFLNELVRQKDGL